MRSLKEFKESLAEHPENFGTNKCVSCGCDAVAKGFVDELSRREFKISQMCQTCQDEVFNTDEDE